MESHEVMRKAVGRVGAKKVAAEMNLSTALIYKWCESPRIGPDGEASGSRNPLDRVREVYDITGDDALIGWLCRQARGYLVKNSNPPKRIAESILHTTQMMVKEFSEVLQAVSESVTDGSGVDDREAARIRKEWEDLKQLTEGFVAACETGKFYKESLE